MKSQGAGHERDTPIAPEVEHADGEQEEIAAHAAANAHHDISQIAAAGVEDAEGALPHASAIQQSFGDVADVSRIKTSVGGKGAAAAERLGARAYASGDRIAFASEPDLHTAAHEAAHVVQNRAANGPARADNGATTAPGDAHEQHADAVADRVVAGAPAGDLLRSAPVGTGAVARKPAAKDPADTARLDVMTQLDKGIKDPAKLARQIPLLDLATRVKIREEKMPVIEARCTAAQVISIQDAVENSQANILASALRKNASALELARTFGRLGMDDLLSLEDGVVSQLRAKLKGPPRAYNSNLELVDPKLNEGAPKLVRWIVESSATADGLVRELPQTSSAAKSLARTLDVEGLWDWTKRVTGAGYNVNQTDTLRTIIPFAPADAAQRLQAIADKSPRLPSAMESPDPAIAKQGLNDLEAGQKAAAASLTSALAGSQPLDARQLLALAGTAYSEGRSVVANPRYRARLSATFDADQAVAFTRALELSSTEALGLLLEVKGVGAPQIIDALRAQGGDDQTWLANPAVVRRVTALLGADLDLMIATDNPAAVQRAALVNSDLLGRLVDGVSPKSVLRFATAGDSADSIARACKAIAARRGYGWVYELVDHGNAESTGMHRLSLACPDAGAKQYLVKHGLQEPAPQHEIVAGSEPIPADNYTRPDQRLETDASADIANDAAELTDTERDAVRAKPGGVGAAIRAAGRNAGADAIRVARDLHATLAETLRALAEAHVDHSAMRSFAAERPSAEQVEVAATTELSKSAERMLDYSPLHTLPAIADPVVLATALTRNPGLLGWIARTTSGKEAISILGANEAVAAASARAMEHLQDFSLVRAIPFTGATSAQRSALVRIGNHAADPKLRDSVNDRTDEDAAGPQSQPSHGLGEQLDELKATARGAQEVQAACGTASKEQVIELLADASRLDRIKFLELLMVSPFTVFPWLRGLPATNLGIRYTFVWLLRTEEPVGLLRYFGKDPVAIAKVAGLLDEQDVAARSWLDRLPSGFGLSPADEAALYQMFHAVSDKSAAMDLFAKRFGKAPEGEWQDEDLDTMWVTLGRLPDRQVVANPSFQVLKRMEHGGEAAAEYNPGAKAVEIGPTPSSEDRYTNDKPRTKPELIAALGIDEKEFDSRLAAKSIESKQVNGVTLYRLAKVDGEGLTDTLLHEMGHAVDAMLGGRTDLVFGMAGWRTYASGDFEAWAADMNGWAGAAVSDEDKAEIRMLFEERLKSSSAIRGPSSDVATLAPSSHALNKKRNENAFLAKEAKTSAFNYLDPVQHGSRIFLLNHYYGQFMSYDAKIHDILPLPYAGFAPGEFFAECYVEYYRNPKSRGGNLPGWIRTWFDTNVDKAGHMPASH